MSAEFWERVLQLPSCAYTDERRVPKAAIVRRGDLTKKEQKALDKASGIEHFATLEKRNAHLAPSVDEAHDARAVIFLRVTMAEGSEAFGEIAGVLHPCFPNPTVLLMESDAVVCVSAASTRLSQAEHGRAVVESRSMSGGFSPDDERYADFLAALAYDALPQTSVLRYVGAVERACRLARAVPALGFYPQCPASKQAQLEGLLARLTGAAREAASLAEQRRETELTLNERARLRMAYNQAKRERDGLAEEVRALCQ